jgi:hypothetical protein
MVIVVSFASVTAESTLIAGMYLTRAAIPAAPSTTTIAIITVITPSLLLFFVIITLYFLILNLL